MSKVVSTHGQADVRERLQRGSFSFLQRTSDPALLEGRLRGAIAAAFWSTFTQLPDPSL